MRTKQKQKIKKLDLEEYNAYISEISGGMQVTVPQNKEDN